MRQTRMHGLEQEQKALLLLDLAVTYVDELSGINKYGCVMATSKFGFLIQVLVIVTRRG